MANKRLAIVARSERDAESNRKIIVFVCILRIYILNTIYGSVQQKRATERA